MRISRGAIFYFINCKLSERHCKHGLVHCWKRACLLVCCISQLVYVIIILVFYHLGGWQMWRIFYFRWVVIRFIYHLCLDGNDNDDCCNVYVYWNNCNVWLCNKGAAIFSRWLVNSVNHSILGENPFDQLKPCIMQHINRHAMSFFVASNLSTGTCSIWNMK